VWGPRRGPCEAELSANPADARPTVTDHDTPFTAPTVDVDYAKLRWVAVTSMAIGLGALIILAILNSVTTEDHGRDFFLAYLVGWVFWLSVPLGRFALLYLGYTTTASWALVVRRFFQAATRTLPWMAAMSLPIVLGMLWGGETSPYWWNSEPKDLTPVAE